MKKYVFMDIMDIIFIPVITYLLSGLLLIQLCGFSVDATSFVVWGVMAGIVLGIQKWFSNKAVTVGIVVYALAMIGWFVFYMKSDGIGHAILIGLSFAAILALRFLMKKRTMKIVAGYGLMAIMIYGAIVELDFSKMLVGFAIILFLNAVSESIAIFHSGNVKSLIVIYVIVALVTLVMPVSEEPYGWDFVFEFIEKVEKTIDAIVDEINYQFADTKFDGIFRFGTTGYSNSAMNLSEGLMEQDVDQLMLYGYKTKRNLYLKGNICNEYSGNGWETQLGGENIDYRVDALMTLYAIFQETQERSELHKFMEIKKHEISLKNLKTQSLFYPVKILQIDADDTVSVGDALRASQVNVRGYTYSYYFVDIDYANKTIINILENSSQIEYEEDAYNRIYEVIYELYGIELEKIPFDEFCAAAKRSSQLANLQCTEISDYVSDDVIELASKLSADCDNVYEICKSTEKYMYQYSYNKAVSVPDGVNVLDWFLFEGKEGYCAHYATSLAVMLRSSGVPTRLAEGFLVDYSDFVNNTTYIISSNTAHAWVEAYIEGFGWIRLEPTVVNAGNANSVWYTDGEPEDDDMPEEGLDEEIEPDNKEEKQRISWMMMLKLLGGMVILVVIILVGLLIYRQISIRRSAEPDIVFSHMISVLGHKYFIKNPSETIAEYFARLKAECEIEEDVIEELGVVQKTMEMYWYGGGSVPEDIIDLMKQISRT